MERALTWTAIIVVCGLLYSAGEASAASRRPQRTTTATPEPAVPTSKYYHPAEVTKPRVLEQTDQRYLDGNFEYKFVLSNGVSRHEKSYWTPVGDSKALARKGYYSHPLPNGKFLTVYYTADENGFHQDSATYSDIAPVLPRSLEVPHHEFPKGTSTTTTTRKPRQKRPSRKPQPV